VQRHTSAWQTGATSPLMAVNEPRVVGPRRATSCRSRSPLAPGRSGVVGPCLPVELGPRTGRPPFSPYFTFTVASFPPRLRLWSPVVCIGRSDCLGDGGSGGLGSVCTPRFVPSSADDEWTPVNRRLPPPHRCYCPCPLVAVAQLLRSPAWHARSRWFDCPAAPLLRWPLSSRQCSARGQDRGNPPLSSRELRPRRPEPVRWTLNASCLRPALVSQACSAHDAVVANPPLPLVTLSHAGRGGPAARCRSANGRPLGLARSA